MFPNVRLMIVAMFASIVAISCGMGMFAAFRVNHEPLARLRSGNPPLQLVFGNGAPAPVTDAATAPFGVRFQLNAPAAVPTMLASSDHPLLAAPATADASSGDAPAPTAASTDSGQEASQQTGQDPNSATGQDAKTDAAVDVALQSPAEQPPPADPAPDANPPPESAVPTDEKTIVETMPTRAAPAAHRPPRRRVVKLRRPRQPQAATAAPSPVVNFALPSNYQSAPQATAQTAPAPQAVKRRVATKRRRPTKQTAAKQPAARPTVIGGTSSP